MSDAEDVAELVARANDFVMFNTGGSVFPIDLAAGQKLRVDTGCMVAMQTSVSYDIQFVGGFKNAMFGGEGLFFAALEGPGRGLLQTLPLSRLADRIVAASGIANKSSVFGDA